MKINKEILKSFKPCTDRYENFLRYHAKFDGSFDEFIDLENVSYTDKIWVAKEALNKNQLCHFALLCAESVLHIFESKYPDDKRVGDCIRYLKGISNFSEITETQREEIIKHRRAAAYATYAAYAADAAAIYAAYAGLYAADAAAHATYAATAYAAAHATYAATAYAAAADADAAMDEQQKINLEFLKMAASL